METIDEYIESQLSKHRITGASVAVVKDGALVLAGGYGLANVEMSVPAAANTVYQIASVTKPFTATATMMLAEEGKLGLDDSVTAQVPELPAAWEPVTVRHLLNHTSGIKSYTSVPDLEHRSRRDHTPREVLEIVAGQPLEFAPGEEFRYNNTGYFLLGMLIEQVSGKSYSEFLNERMFQPLNMTHTRVNDLRAIIPNRAQGYSLRGADLQNGDYVSPTLPFAAGALVSAVEDLAKWDAALYTEKVLPRAVLEQMWTPTVLNSGKVADYGFGWQTAHVNGHRMVGHTGGIPGFATRLVRFPDDKLTVVLLSNSDHCDATAFARGVAGCVLPDVAKQPELAIEDADPQITERLTRVILDAMRGALDPDQFTDAVQQVLAARLQQQQTQLAEFGELKTLELLEKTVGEQSVSFRYWAAFTHETVEIRFTLDEAGKIAGLGVQRGY